MLKELIFKLLPDLINSGLRDIRREKLNQIFPQKPTTLNLMINDICNSRCQMCLIWKNKKSYEITPDELNKILDDDLFSNLQYVGVSGGEPTLRKDLTEICTILCSKKNIKSIGLISNGIIEDSVKTSILECYRISENHNKDFNIMISLDGLEDVHDSVRGRKNNFQSAVNLINFFHSETNIPTSFGCTITSTNAPFVDELLDFAIEKGIYGRFRIAEFIDRLYNSEQLEHIRNFTDKMKYHLGLFFFRAEHEFEPSYKIKKTYRSIRAMLTENKPRQIGCPYQVDSVVLTSKGDLLYCSPKSPILGNAIQKSSSELFFSNLQTRKKIKENHCKDCIHDYHEPITFKDRLSDLKTKWKEKYVFNCKKLTQESKKLPTKTKIKINPMELESKTVLIVGWYGTETIGDKAILHSVISRMLKRKQAPNKIYLASLYPFISQRTIQEIELDNIEIIETYSPRYQALSSSVDEIVVGGGPLMDIACLNLILYSFIAGYKSKSINRIEGCGIGPLNKPHYIEMVNEIFKLSDDIILRDSRSSERCKNEFNISSVKTDFDPAYEYVLLQKNILQKNRINYLNKQNNYASCFLREWTREYSGDMDISSYSSYKEIFENELLELLIYVSQSESLELNLLPMHCFHIGGDDRSFNRKIATKISNQNNFNTLVKYTQLPVTPKEILEAMYSSRINICMRFHSVLFAETLGVPYLAIDYTNGGKIKSFLQDRNSLWKMISMNEIKERQWQDKVKQILSNYKSNLI